MKHEPLTTRAFDLACLSVLVVVAAHAPHLPAWFTLAFLGLLGARWWQRNHGGRRVPAWLKLPLVGLLVLAVLVTWGTPFGRAPGSALAVGLLVLKMLEAETARDARSAIAFACFVLMSALLFKQSLIATILVTLGLVPALACLRALQPEATERGWKRQGWAQLKVLAFAVPLALIAFLFVPRLSSPLWGAPAADQGKTGLSPEMSPANLSQLLIDDRTAMRVSFDGNLPGNAERYFRGYVLWQFDGRTWHIGWQRRSAREPLTAYNDIGYQIDLEPTSRHLIPALAMTTRAPPDTRLTNEHMLVTRQPINAPSRYALHAATRYRLGERLDARSRRRALELPPGFDPRSRALAQSWRQKFGADDAAIVGAALDLIRDGGFSYTLAPPPLGRNSIDDFLFSTRQGFCEHYASSFAFLMRAAGVPARVVTGYQGGQWNRFGHYLQVRYSDAHAWDEVWLDDRGWVRVDPTAAVRPDRISEGAVAAAGDSAAWYQSAWLRALGNRWDIVNRWWTDAVIGFNALRQRSLLTPFGIRDADAGKLTLALAIGLMLVLALAALWILRRPRDPDPLVRAQQQLEAWLARRGVARRPQEGPRDFFARARIALPERAGQLEALAARYLQLRYGQPVAANTQVARYREAIREFRRGHAVK